MSDDPLIQAQEHLRAGEPQQAARSLRFAAQSSTLHQDDEAFSVLLQVVAGIGGSMQLDKLRELSIAVETDQGLFNLGYELIEVGLPEVAVPVLQRVQRALPDDPAVVEELAAALERSQRHAEARDVLLGAPDVLQTFWMRYLVVFNALCAGDADTARTHAALLQPTEESHAIGTARVAAMLARLDRLSEPLALRQWQYALNGSLLLHVSPYGFDEGMNGRYAYSQDSVVSIRRDLNTLLAGIDAPRTVSALPDRGSRIIAGALASLWSVPCFEDDGAGLIVGYHLDAEASAPSFDRLFARSVCWTSPPRPPAYIGLLAQTLIAPWDGGMRHDGEQVVRMPPSDEPDAHWIQQILDADGADDEQAPGDSFEERVQFLKHTPADPGDMFLEGPIRSSRFL